MTTVQTPKTEGFRQPAEWDKHKACWLAWPCHEHLWRDHLIPAQREFTALCKAIGLSENLNVLVDNSTAEKEAKKALEGLPVTFYSIQYGDIWLRDTAPIFLKNTNGQNATVRFGFNGWGGKYVLPHDADVSKEIGSRVDQNPFFISEVLEGGAVDVDGAGTCLTTKQCLLNPNRNGPIDIAKAESFLKAGLGVEKVLWLGDGLLNDHTDGHVDTLARFSSVGTVLCMSPSDADDPNKIILEKINHDLKSFGLNVIEIPSPGKIEDEDGRIMPASYMNFYISNEHVIVPLYGSKNDEGAVSKIAACFPSRKTIGLSARAILSGGGAFHCITQQQPL